MTLQTKLFPVAFSKLCIPLTDDHDTLEVVYITLLRVPSLCGTQAILDAAPWPQPVKAPPPSTTLTLALSAIVEVYGYNYDALVGQGGFFEADTLCDARMAQIASGGVLLSTLLAPSLAPSLHPWHTPNHHTAAIRS